MWSVASGAVQPPTLFPTSGPARCSSGVSGTAVTSNVPHLAAWHWHDMANLAALPLITVLSLVSLVSPKEGPRRALAFGMLAYIAADSAWIAAQPDVVRAPVPLLFHHFGTLILLLHSLSHAPHLRYVACMTLVELNSFFLILRRHVKRLWIELAFAATWLGIRVAWFPYLTGHLVLQCADWPAGSAGRRRLVLACASSVTLLQLCWTPSAFHSVQRHASGILRLSRDSDGDSRARRTDGGDGFFESF
jgi:hypothetical protein